MCQGVMALDGSIAFNREDGTTSGAGHVTSSRFYSVSFKDYVLSVESLYLYKGKANSCKAKVQHQIIISRVPFFSMPQQLGPPEASAVSDLIKSSGAKSASEALPLEILHNLQYQHDWTDLHLHALYTRSSGTDADNSRINGLVGLEVNSYFSQLDHQSHSQSPSSSGLSTPTNDNSHVVHLISGLPPRHGYIHPDLQLHLLKHKIPESSIPVQREFVLPMSLAQKYTLSRFCAVFDSLPEREQIVVNPVQQNEEPQPSANGSAHSPSHGRRTPYEHKDQKRVLLGMKAKEGGGGDGTVVYYIMQEGEVKPRQNG